MASEHARTLYRRQARLFAVPIVMLAVMIGFCGVLGGLLAPLVWKGTSVVVALSIGVPVTALAVWVLWVGWRFARILLIASPGGVFVRGPLHDHEFTWDQIQGFERGWSRPWSASGSDCPVVVIRVTDGRAITVHALRVGCGANGVKRAERDVDEICRELERLRPGPAQQTARARDGSSAVGATR